MEAAWNAASEVGQDGTYPQAVVAHVVDSVTKLKADYRGGPILAYEVMVRYTGSY